MTEQQRQLEAMAHRWLAAPRRLYAAMRDASSGFSLYHLQNTTVNASHDFGIRHSTVRGNVKQRLLHMGATILHATALPLSTKRKIDVIDASHERPSKRQLTSRDVRIPASSLPSPRRTKWGFYDSQNPWCPDINPLLSPHKRGQPLAPLDGLSPLSRSLVQSRKGIHAARRPLNMSLNKLKEDEVNNEIFMLAQSVIEQPLNLNKWGLAPGSGPELAKDEFQERDRAKAEKLAAEKRARFEERERKAQHDDTTKQAIRAKKKKLLADFRRKEREKKQREYLEEKKGYETFVNSLGSSLGNLSLDDAGSNRVRLDRDGRPLVGKLVEKRRLISKLSGEWDCKIKNALALRSEHSIIGKSVEGVELSRKDLARILPGEPWLNDEVVNAWYANLCARLNERDGYVKSPNNVPRWVAYSTAWYKNATERGVASIAGWSRRKGIKNDKLLRTDRIFFPTNTGVHWTLLTISGKRKTIEYLDSMSVAGYESQRNIDLAKNWLRMELGSKFVGDEWQVLRTTSAQQNNSNDCGVFACLNGWALGKGLEDPSGEFDTGEIPLARRMVAAVLMNGGFTGDFDL